MRWPDATRTGDVDAVLSKVERALMQNRAFQAAARPRRFSRLVLSRSSGGQTYGAHVDDAIMGGTRTDLSFTLFLSDEDVCEGGALRRRAGCGAPSGARCCSTLNAASTRPHRGKTPLFDRLAKTRSNLLRMWAEG